MTRGRKPKTDAEKQLAGNPGKRSASASGAPQPAQASKRAPTGMSAEARKYWHTVADELIRLGVLSIVDVPAFLLMAEHYALARRVMGELLEREALTVIDKNDAERKNPLLQVFKDNAAAYRLFAADFGLTPASRARLNIKPPEAEQLTLAQELFGMIREDENGGD